MRSPLPGALIIWLALPIPGVLAEPVTGVWWRDCEFDSRYDIAYDNERTYGRASPIGGWNLPEVTKFAQRGDACMQYILGQLLEHLRVRNVRPVDLPIDWNEAAKWYRLAADQGHGDAQSSLAGHHFMGTGARQDYVEAVKWSRKTADQGLSCAQLQLGEMYRDAQGAPRDTVRAHMWMNLAATDQLGFDFGRGYCVEAARTERQDLATKMTPAQITEAQRLARDWKPKISQDPVGHRTYKER